MHRALKTLVLTAWICGCATHPTPSAAPSGAAPPTPVAAASPPAPPRDEPAPSAAPSVSAAAPAAQPPPPPAPSSTTAPPPPRPKPLVKPKPAAGGTPARAEAPPATPAGPPAAGGAASGQPPSPPPAPAAKPGVPTLDLPQLEQRLRDTRAIGVFTKLSLKNQVDDLLDAFRDRYRAGSKQPTPELRQRYDLLLLKVLTLLQDGDPSLASAISSSRETIWGILADPGKFEKI